MLRGWKDRRRMARVAEELRQSGARLLPILEREVSLDDASPGAMVAKAATATPGSGQPATARENSSEVGSLLTESRRAELDRLERVYGLLCWMPDDPLDLATSYLRDRAEDELLLLDVKYTVIDADAGTGHIEAGLERLNMFVRAINTDYEAAVRVAMERNDAASAELRDKIEAVTRHAEDSVKRLRRSLRRITWIPRLLRMTTLFAIAILSWWIGSRFHALAVGIQAIIALILFAVVDLWIVDGLIIPRLQRLRRRALETSGKTIVREMKEADRKLDVVVTITSHHERRS